MNAPIGTHTSFATIPENLLSRIVRALRCPGRNTKANSSVYMGILFTLHILTRLSAFVNGKNRTILY